MTSRDALQRKAWADRALVAYCSETGCGSNDCLALLLCDLMHWSDFGGMDFEAALHRARTHYAEVSR